MKGSLLKSIYALGGRMTASRPIFEGVRKAANSNPLVVLYHLVSDGEFPHVKHGGGRIRSSVEFQEEIDFFLKHYHPISLSDLLASIYQGRALPENCFLLTFDDGLREFIEIAAPILLKKGVPAAMFLTPDSLDNGSLLPAHKTSLLYEKFRKSENKIVSAKVSQLLFENQIVYTEVGEGILSLPHNYLKRHLIDRFAEILEVDFSAFLKEYQPYLTTNQAQQLLADGFTIGSHSLDHPLYSECPLDEQVHQTVDSTRLIREKFNLDYGAFAAPFHDMGLSRDYFKAIEQGGVDISFGTSFTRIEGSPKNFQRLSMERSHYPASKFVLVSYGKKIFNRTTGRGYISRDKF